MTSKKKIVVLGSTGMAGHVIYNYLEGLDKYEICNISFRQRLNDSTIILDVRNFEKLKSQILTLKPDFIINAIGILVRGSQDAANAILLNAYLPHFLENVCRDINSKLIHISTDCVFKGNSKGGYTEESFKDADDTYGRSKALGEITNEKDVTIRTSIIGPEIKQNGEGLFHWFLNQKGQIQGFSNVYWSGVTTMILAKAIEAIMVNGVVGLCHLTNNEKISKYSLLKLMQTIWSKNDVEITENGSLLKDKSFLDTKSKINMVVPSYTEMLKEMHDHMLANESLFAYSRYYNLNGEN